MKLNYVLISLNEFNEFSIQEKIKDNYMSNFPLRSSFRRRSFNITKIISDRSITRKKEISVEFLLKRYIFWRNINLTD